MDLSFSDLKDNKFKVAFIRIDIVTTYTVVIPIKSRSIEDVAMEITEVINKKGEEAMNGYMQIWKKSFNSSVARDYFEKDSIKLPLTRGHASVVERAICTIKDMVYKRLEHTEKKGKEVDWSDCLFEVVLTYKNTMVHSATEMRPSEARKEKKQQGQDEFRIRF